MSVPSDIPEVVSGTYLDRIVADVVGRVRERKERRPQRLLESLPTPPGRPSFAEAMRLPGISLIAEVKRASPSKGPIRPELEVGHIVAAYERAGARAVSVLTEEDHFRGSLADLEAASVATSLPLLRKDFVVDEYQIEEARVAGASAVLLIAALLPDSRLSELAAYAAAAGLDVLLEVHDQAELQRALRQPGAIIGINNRDLRTFEVSLTTTEMLAGQVPRDRILVSESGIAGAADVERLRACGAAGMLVGESLLRRDDVEAAVRGLVGPAAAGPTGPVVKLCGLTRIADVVEAHALRVWALGLIFAPSPRRLTPDQARDLLRRAAETVRRMEAREAGSVDGGSGLMPASAQERALEFAVSDSADAASGPLKVGVFVDAGADQIASVTTYVGLGAVQLHGEGGAAPAAVRRALAAADAEKTLIIRAVGVAPDETDVAGLRARLLATSEEADLLLIDANVPGAHGGTGRVLPWQVVGEAAAGMRFLLAGGISPRNAAGALAASGAWGLDVASGVEKAPGIKDHAAMRALVAAVHEKGTTP